MSDAPKIPAVIDGKPVTLVLSVQPGDLPEFMRDHERGMRLSGSGATVPCRCCEAMFVATGWCFYQLCGPCFGRYDQWKMARRFASPPLTESCDLWTSEQAGARVPASWMAL